MKFLVVLFAVLAVMAVATGYVQRTVTYTEGEPSYVAGYNQGSTADTAARVAAAAPGAAASVIAAPFIAAADAVHNTAHGQGHQSTFGF